MNGYQAYQNTRAKLSRQTGYHSDLSKMSDEELVEKQKKAEDWLPFHTDHRLFDHFQERYEAICKELNFREMAKEKIVDPPKQNYPIESDYEFTKAVFAAVI